jgi:glycosyltransferase involved in cell wall biosynthesis
MVYLEAQAHGVPVVAEDRPGVNEVVDPSGLVAQGAPEKMSGALSRLLTDEAYHIQRSRAARVLVQDTHLLSAAKETVWRVLRPMMKERS